MLLALALLLATPLATTPAAAPSTEGTSAGFPLHLSVGFNWTFPSESGGSTPTFWLPLRQGFAWSVELTYEFSRAFVAFDVTNQSGNGFCSPICSSQVSEFHSYSLSAGYFFGTGQVRPLASVGIGYLTQRIDYLSDASAEEEPVDGAGAAVVVEAGVLFGRDHAMGRLAVVARLIQPLYSFDAVYYTNYVPANRSEFLAVLTLGLRLGF